MTEPVEVLIFPSHLSPVIRTRTTAHDANPSGDIFGGWLLAQMDLAGGVAAFGFARNRVVTVGVEAMSFHEPVFIGDEILFFTEIQRIGNTSITIRIAAWVMREQHDTPIHVTDGLFTFVSIDKAGRPQLLSKTTGKNNRNTNQ